LAGSLVLAQQGFIVLALFCSFIFFLLGLRLVHGAFHHALGLPAFATDTVMAVLSLVMLGSMHAVRYNHLQHHKHCLDEHDVEGMCARLPAWLALLIGPWFPIRMHIHALRQSRWRDRGWMVAELSLGAAWIVIVFGLLDLSVLRYHVVVMVIGQCLTGFFAVWTVHHGCDRSGLFARTLRGRFKNAVSFSMFYHLEHHLFPRVPTCRLAQLSERLDGVCPELSRKQVF